MTPNRDEAYQAGDIVYVLYRNPHAQDVANVSAAAVVASAERPDRLALFLHETQYELSDELAVFPTRQEAERAYAECFGDVGEAGQSGAEEA